MDRLELIAQPPDVTENPYGDLLLLLNSDSIGKETVSGVVLGGVIGEWSGVELMEVGIGAFLSSGPVDH